MKILVLDPRAGDRVTDLFIIDPNRRTVDAIRLNYAPEMQLDASSRELLIVETDLYEGAANDATTYWLRMYDAETFRRVREVETPVRPMYAGYPNRSTRVRSSVSGRYVYMQELCTHPERLDLYRTWLRRYDRRLDVLERGIPCIDSCSVDFGTLGTSDEDIFFHLTCEEPNTIAFARFSSADIEFVRLTDFMTARTYTLQETCGSWFDAPTQSLFCTTREGSIYRARQPPAASALWLRLPIEEPRTVPLQHVHSSRGRLFVGVARDRHERSLSLVSEVWEIAIDDATIQQVIALPSPVINFVTAENTPLLLGVDPYRSALYFMDLTSGKLLDQITDLGMTPAEVQVVP